MRVGKLSPSQWPHSKFLPELLLGRQWQTTQYNPGLETASAEPLLCNTGYGTSDRLYIVILSSLYFVRLVLKQYIHACHLHFHWKWIPLPIFPGSFFLCHHPSKALWGFTFSSSNPFWLLPLLYLFSLTFGITSPLVTTCICWFRKVERSPPRTQGFQLHFSKGWHSMNHVSIDQKYEALVFLIFCSEGSFQYCRWTPDNWQL